MVHNILSVGVTSTSGD